MLDMVKQFFTTSAPRRVSPTKAVGVSGSAVDNGFLRNVENDARLNDTERYRTFSDILVNTSIVGAGVRYLLNLVARAEWTVNPADDTPAAREAAEMVQTMMDDMRRPWARVIRTQATHRLYGFSVQEWIAARDANGRFAISDIQLRPQRTIDRWDLTDQGIINGLTQLSPKTHQELYIPRQKFIYAVDDALHDSPEGLGLMRHIALPALRLKEYLRLEQVGLQGDLNGVPVARVPFSKLREAHNGSDEDLAATLNQAKQSFLDFMRPGVKTADKGLILDSKTYDTEDTARRPSTTYEYDISVLTHSPQSVAEVGAAIQRINHEIARIIGVQHLLLGSDGSGSLALGRAQLESFFLIVDSTVKELKESYDRDFIGSIWSLNGLDPALMPEFSVEATQFQDVEMIAAALNEIAQASLILDASDPAIDEVRALMGLSPQPEVADDDLTLRRPNAASLTSDGSDLDESDSVADLEDEE